MLQDAVGAFFSNPRALDLTNYVAAPNLVTHFADLIRIYQVYSPVDIGAALTLNEEYIAYTNQQHDMFAITQLFDPVTGEKREYNLKCRQELVRMTLEREEVMKHTSFPTT